MSTSFIHVPGDKSHIDANQNIFLFILSLPSALSLDNSRIETALLALARNVTALNGRANSSRPVGALHYHWYRYQSGKAWPPCPNKPNRIFNPVLLRRVYACALSCVLSDVYARRTVAQSSHTRAALCFIQLRRFCAHATREVLHGWRRSWTLRINDWE